VIVVSPRDDQVLVKARDRGQPPLDRASRQTALAIFDADYPVAESRFALGLDEREDVRCDDVPRVLVNDAEEHLQVEGVASNVFCRARALTRSK